MPEDSQKQPTLFNGAPRFGLQGTSLAVVLMVALGAGFVSGAAFGTRLDPQLGQSAQAVAGWGTSAPPEGVDFSPVWKAWEIIDERFVPVGVATTTTNGTSTVEKNEVRVWGMVQGLAESLGDPYTFFLPPAENEIFESDISGAFQGVGMEIAIRNRQLVIVSPLKGTPAERAGLKSGDAVLEINEVDTRDMDITEAVGHIRGPKGSVVRLLILREGWSEPKEIKVTRDTINIPTVETSTPADDVFVIEVMNFSAQAPLLFRSALREFVQSGRTKLILDLRGNPGGYLEGAVEMASWFLPTGKVVVTEDYAGHASNIVHRSRGYDIFNENLRMVILVDRGSASASEIFADALRHWKKAKLIGVNTFGKGSVQELVPITDDTALKITVARWIGPGGTPIPVEGIEPDVLVEITDEEREAGEDPQMEKAIEFLNK